MEEENKDTIEKEETVEIAETNNEEIKIADDVVSIIAGKAVSEISGVAGMADLLEVFQKFLAEKRTYQKV